MDDTFEGWPADGPTLLAAVAADNTRESWAGHRERHVNWVLAPMRVLTGTPRGYPACHPRIGLLRQRGLQVVRTWELGPWLQTTEPLRRVRQAWRAAAPLVGWLDVHVGPAGPAGAGSRG